MQHEGIIRLHNRIRRGDHIPPFVLGEEAGRHRYPHSIIISEAERLIARYRRGRFTKLGDYPRFRRREGFAWLYRASERVAAVQMFEYQLPQDVSDEDWFEAADSEDNLAMQLAECMADGWPGAASVISDEGTIVEVRMAWSRNQDAPRGAWARMTQVVADEAFPRHAFLAMKCCPLEYENIVNEESGLSPAFEARKRAMMRYYQRLFDVQPIPGAGESEGWLYYDKLQTPLNHIAKALAGGALAG